MSRSIVLSETAQHNGLACMLAELIRTNLTEHPDKNKIFETLRGTIAIIAEDAQVGLTLQFDFHGLVIHDGIQGIPNITIRAQSDDIAKLSLMRFSTPLGLPALWDDTTRNLMTAILKRRVRVYAAPHHLSMLGHVSQLLSVD